MKRSFILKHLPIIIFLLFLARQVSGQQARWITSADCKNDTNTWICMQKVERLKAEPKKAVARIAADSKYWLWINGKLVVREGVSSEDPILTTLITTTSTWHRI